MDVKYKQSTSILPNVHDAGPDAASLYSADNCTDPNAAGFGRFGTGVGRVLLCSRVTTKSETYLWVNYVILLAAPRTKFCLRTEIGFH